MEIDDEDNLNYEEEEVDPNKDIDMQEVELPQCLLKFVGKND